MPQIDRFAAHSYASHWYIVDTQLLRLTAMHHTGMQWITSYRANIRKLQSYPVEKAVVEWEHTRMPSYLVDMQL
jgi:hypothetical protein